MDEDIILAINQVRETIKDDRERHANFRDDIKQLFTQVEKNRLDIQKLEARITAEELREKSREDKGKESWTRWMGIAAIIISILAVITTL